MSNTIERRVAEKVSSTAPEIDKNQAVSGVLPFAVAKPMLKGCPAPRRPNRTRPMDDPHLRDELDAWELAGDEAFELTEGELPE